MTDMILHNGDCLEILPTLPASSVDLIIADPPYGTTACKWDTVIRFDDMWQVFRRVAKPNAAICIFATMPFTATLVCSNLDEYRHRWIWNKNNSAGFATAKLRPFQICEDVLVFSREKAFYYPQMETRGKMRVKGGYSTSDNYGITPTKSVSNVYYPKNLLNYPNASQVGKVHPTQKPVPLIEYLIKTYSREGETVLDPVMGSGSTGEACRLSGRKFVGVELDSTYFAHASKRLKAG